MISEKSGQQVQEKLAQSRQRSQLANFLQAELEIVHEIFGENICEESMHYSHIEKCNIYGPKRYTRQNFAVRDRFLRVRSFEF